VPGVYLAQFVHDVAERRQQSVTQGPLRQPHQFGGLLGGLHVLAAVARLVRLGLEQLGHGLPLDRLDRDGVGQRDLTGAPLVADRHGVALVQVALVSRAQWRLQLHDAQDEQRL
jgi:hypothetical protein